MPLIEPLLLLGWSHLFLRLNHRAIAINPLEKIVTAVNTQGQQGQIGYFKLIIATGATSRRPKIEGLDNPGVYFLRWMGDSFALHQHLTQHHPKSALIIGGGYIGMEMADALTLRGLKVTVVEHSPTVLKTTCFMARMSLDSFITSSVFTFPKVIFY